MTTRQRIVAFGSAGAAVAAGAICAVLVGGLTGQVIALALMSAGLGAVVLLVFLEVGLSEDRQRALDEERRRKRLEHRDGAEERPKPRRRPRRPG